VSRFGEPKPVERIKVLPQKTIKKVASKQRIKMPKACIYAGFRHLFYQMALVWLYLWGE
jgi:hypothetical protein